MRAVAAVPLVVAGALAGPGPAAAGPSAVPPVLPPGVCEGSLVAEASLSLRRIGEPVSLAPDLACGLSPRLTVAVTHSARALSEIDSGDGLCLSGPGHGCPRVYDHVGLDVRSLVPGGQLVRVAARVRLVARSLEPFKPSVRLGAVARAGRGRVSVVVDPHLGIGLANHDLGNRDFVALPIFVELGFGAVALARLQTGIRGELAYFDEVYAVPVGAELFVAITPRWIIGVEAGFPKLLGPQNTFKQRHAAVSLTVRFETATPRPP